MNFDGLIFDLDGTLWDCSRASTEAFNLAFAKFGVERRVTEQFVKSISGKPANVCNEILLAGIPDSIRQKVMQCLDQFEIAEIVKQAPFALYDAVYEGLHTLSQRYTLFVVSNCGQLYLETFHQYTRIGHLFLDSECFGRTGQHKGANIRALVDRQGLKCACYIGDTAGDEKAAAQAGVPFFHAAYGFGKPVGNPVAFTSFGELTSYFKELSQLRDTNLDNW